MSLIFHENRNVGSMGKGSHDDLKSCDIREDDMGNRQT